MRPIVLPVPSPGKHTIRVPLDPQPLFDDVDTPAERLHRLLFIEKYSPYKPGETYNDGSCLSVDLEHGDGWEWVIEFEVTNTRSE